jgi:3'-phosphoadenosine 5'-phosphosulfate sulfotransferase (PAPS reductase)/FAD synthetase
MLWRVLQSNNGLPDQAKAIFCNTGKEDEATLRFIHDCSVNWGIPITWLEYRVAEVPFEVVNFDTASRNGEPFSALIKKKNYLPNPVARFCTVDLKILTLERYIKSVGWAEYENMIGIRADEPRRVAKIRANPSDGRKGVSRFMPLAQVGVQKEDISQFWKSHGFDLGLPNIGGVTYHGNCDLCFLKGASQLMSLIAEKPERAVWWAAQEGTISNAHIKDGGLFRKDRPSYAQMLKYSEQQDDMFAAGDDESIACFCGD